ncbi:MAG: helix-turn-helix domain-containing protein [Hyphomicrobiales bacterium]
MARRDVWPARIHYLLRRRGLTYADVDRQYGLKEGTACNAARKAHLPGELALADALNLSPRQLWPSRYDDRSGERLKPQPRTNYKGSPRGSHGQKEGAQ